MGLVHRRLKTRLFDNDMTQRYLAKELGKSPRYVSVRINGKLPWDLSDVYKICDLLKIPYAEISDYFPPIKAAKRGGGKCTRLQ